MLPSSTSLHELWRGEVSRLVQNFHDTLCGSGDIYFTKAMLSSIRAIRDVHDVAEQGIQLAGGQRAVQDVLAPNQLRQCCSRK